MRMRSEIYDGKSSETFEDEETCEPDETERETINIHYMVNQMMNRMWPKGNDYLESYLEVILQMKMVECWPKGNVKV